MNQNPAIARTLFFGASASFGGFILGTIIGWSSPAETVTVEYLQIDREHYASIASVMAFGAAISQIFTFGLLTVTGNKVTIIILSLLSLLGWIFLLLANSYGFYLFSRFLQGLFAGGFCVVVPTFICEISHKSVRGGISVLFQFFLVIGIFYSYFLCYVTTLTLFNVTSLIYPLVLAALMSFARESPVHYYKKGMTFDAAKSMQFYRGNDYNIDSEMEEVAGLTQKGELGFCQIISEKSSRKAILMLFTLHAIQQLSGINAMIFYAHIIFQISNTVVDYRLSAILFALVQIVITLVAAIIIDKVGRKILWYVSLSIMAISLFTIGYYFTSYYNDERFVATVPLLPTITICCYMCGYSIGCGPLPWVMIGEVLPTNIKVFIGTSVAFINWMLAFIIIQSYPLLLVYIGIDWAFYIYGGFVVLSVIFVVFCVYETKNKSLGEIQEMLKRN